VGLALNGTRVVVGAPQTISLSSTDIVGKVSVYDLTPYMNRTCNAAGEACVSNGDCCLAAGFVATCELVCVHGKQQRQVGQDIMGFDSGGTNSEPLSQLLHSKLGLSPVLQGSGLQI
jgi:hypothetical protein